jgi:hypothetical protein
MATEPIEATRPARARDKDRPATRSTEDSGEGAIHMRPGALAPLQTQFAALVVLVLVVIVALASWTAAAVIAAIYLLLSLALRQMRRPAQR